MTDFIFLRDAARARGLSRWQETTGRGLSNANLLTLRLRDPRDPGLRPATAVRLADYLSWLESFAGSIDADTLDNLRAVSFTWTGRGA